MESVYIETTLFSYLVARPSRDVVVAGHQQRTAYPPHAGSGGAGRPQTARDLHPRRADGRLNA